MKVYRYRYGDGRTAKRAKGIWKEGVIKYRIMGRANRPTCHSGRDTRQIDAEGASRISFSASTSLEKWNGEDNALPQLFGFAYSTSEVYG